MVGPMPGVEGVRGALVRLRTRSGLSADRLRSTEVGVDSLLDLPVVRHMVTTTDKSPAEAAVEAIRRLAGQLETSDLVIVDAVLSLGLLVTRFPGDPDIEALYAADVGERRERLVADWDRLHLLLGVDRPPKQPTVRSLRASVESAAIGRLAELCVNSSVLDVVAAESDHSRATVTVIGSAVMDTIFVIDHVPSAGSSAPADSFEESPGGKGLNHAVASARLGMDVQLITSVGDDERGNQLLAYLVDDGVRTHLVKIAQGSRTPVVGVFLLRNGGAFHLPWMNSAEVRLDPADFHAGAMRNALETADAVVLTFEPQADAISAALETIGRLDTKPLVVVRPSPTLPNPQVLYEHFPTIDYLVGTQSELRALLPAKRDMTTEEMATSLRLLGVHGVCITEEFGCLIRSEYIREDIARFPTAMRDTPGAREAFSAALIYQLLRKNRKIDRRDLEWATAAMAAAQSFGGIADSMPDQRQVDRVLKVTPEHSLHD